MFIVTEYAALIMTLVIMFVTYYVYLNVSPYTYLNRSIYLGADHNDCTHVRSQALIMLLLVSFFAYCFIFLCRVLGFVL